MKNRQCYKKVYILRLFLFVLVFLFCTANLFSTSVEEDFTKSKIALSDTPSWYTVLGGQAVAKPVKTSYGFAVVSDGRLLSGCSEKGDILWQKSLRQKSSPYFISGYSDTLYLVSQTANLMMFNPSGMLLWEHQLKEYPIENLILGKDGRVFVRGLNTLTCFSMTGKIKWTLNIGQSASINTSIFTDGSLLIILEKEINNCSTALRISPYGNIIEEITFTGKITSTVNSDDGILLGFSNGDVGFINIVEDKAKTSWSISNQTFENSSNCYPVKLFFHKNDFYVCFSNNKIACIQSGRIIWNVVTDIQLNQIQDFFSDNLASYFITGTNTISISRKGILQKNYSYKHGNSSFPFYLEPGYLVFSTSDWCINAYRIVQTTEKYKGKTIIPKSYEDKGYTVQTHYKLDECNYLLQKNDTSKYEKDILQILSYEIQDMMNYYYVPTEKQLQLRSSKGLFETIKILEICGNTGLGSYTNILSLIIEKETDFSVVTAAIKAAGKLGYDDGKIISAMEYLSRKIDFKNDILLQKEFCNTLYQICRFMGKPVLFNKGKDLLFYLLTGTSNEEIKIFTRETMEKIIALQM